MIERPETVRQDSGRRAFEGGGFRWRGQCGATTSGGSANGGWYERWRC
jgi:hypothetical protein